MGDEFKVMHFTQIILQYDLPSGKYMFCFLLFVFFFLNHVKNTG